MDDRALFDPGPLRAGRTANRLDHLLDQEFDAGSPPHIREDPHVFETHQGPHDLDRVSKDEGASGTLAHTTTLEHLRQFRGDLRQGATPLRSEEPFYRGPPGTRSRHLGIKSRGQIVQGDLSCSSVLVGSGG